MALDEEALIYLLILYRRRKRRICNKYTEKDFGCKNYFNIEELMDNLTI